MATRAVFDLLWYSLSIDPKVTPKHTKCILCESNQLAPIKGYEKHDLVRCKRCSMVFIATIPSEEELASFYSTYAYSEDKWISPITIKRYHELLDSMEAYRDSGNILDVGCGAGYFLAVAKERGWNVYGTEYSPAAVSLCEKKGITMSQGPLEASTFEGLSFDVITSFEVLEHIHEAHTDLNLIQKKLRDGGLFYATTPNFNSLNRFQQKADYNVIGYPEHLSYYTRKTLKKLVRKHGLRVLRCTTSGYNFTRRAQGSDDKKEIKIGAANAPDEKVRERTENRTLWKVAKRIANAVFSLSGTGSTLKIWAEKS